MQYDEISGACGRGFTAAQISIQSAGLKKVLVDPSLFSRAYSPGGWQPTIKFRGGWARAKNISSYSMRAP
jgi:hypothetical protein